VIKPIRRRRDAEGNIIETIAGQHLAFTDGRLLVPEAGKIDGEHGEKLDAAEVLAFLLEHPHFDDRHDGFWEHKEVAPAPTVEEQQRLAELAMDLDVEGIESFIAAEEAGWARPELLELAASQLERAKAKATELEERVEKARAEGAASAQGGGASKQQK